MTARLPKRAGERINRNRVVRFEFDGRQVEAYEGDTIGSALFAAGARTFSRSFKYHRRRGLFCCSGQCPNCLVSVDGSPGVRACIERVREGMEVRHLNAFPSLKLDVLSVLDAVGGPLTPPGFYYKTFKRPRRIWPWYEKALRRVAGLGRLPREPVERRWHAEDRHRYADVLVIGGGAAGMRAAIAAAELGADVVLAEEGYELGGRLVFEGGSVRARELAKWVEAAGVEILTNASAIGYFGGSVAVSQGGTLHHVRARQYVMATGAIEQPLAFTGNDRPGVMLSGGAVRLASMFSVRPGRKAVVATTSDRGLEAAMLLRQLGVEVRALVDMRPRPSALARRLGEDTDVLQGWKVVSANGRRQVRSAVVAPTSGDGDSTMKIPCDLLAVSGGSVPAMGLGLQAGGKSIYDRQAGGFMLEGLPDHIHAAGDVEGRGAGDVAERSGELAGTRAAHGLGLGDSPSRTEAERLSSEVITARALASEEALPSPAEPTGGGKCFACLCEDVTEKDISASVAEGYDSIELVKRYSTATMGPCQGRMCQIPTAWVLARETGQELARIGTTTARPPWSTVPLGALAGRPFEPARRSPMQDAHRRLGASIDWAGDWQRPYDYGDPEGEALAVHENVGMIDVSSLGKVVVSGPDAGEFLDRLYPNRISNLRVGRVRYGVITNEAGKIIDDGTICRLDDESFYVTTTSSGADAVEQWFSWWRSCWAMDARIWELTQGVSALNVAGPKSRDVVMEVSDIDLSPDEFTFMDGRQGYVAGAPALLMRLGFVGELGYEIHFASGYGQHVWDALMAAGEKHGIRPFGLEPQRVLRLQKKHVLVGQDTDSESTPFGAGMPWIVKLEKEGDFVGRWALENWASRTPETTLVGVTFDGDRVPAEGSVALDPGGHPAGPVTSVRHSPQLRQIIGLAWVPTELAEEGSSVTVSDREALLEGTVVTQPFFDPEGEALRS